jgi:hypothetical protein
LAGGICSGPGFRKELRSSKGWVHSVTIEIL